MPLTCTTSPTEEPLTVDEVKTFLRIGGLGSGAKISASIGTNQYLTSISVIAGGAGYPSTTTATVVGGTTATAATVALTIASGVITGAAVASSGSGYTAAPVIVISSGDFGIEDTLLTHLISMARERAEWFTQRQCMSASYLYTTSTIETDTVKGSFIRLPKPPLIAVSSVNYVDSTGTTQTMSASDYQVVVDEPPYVRLKTTPAYDSNNPEGLQVRFSCGYTASSAIPFTIIQAIYQAVAEGYRNREEESVAVNSCIDRLLSMKRVWGVGA